jgi:hypothetical protein
VSKLTARPSRAPFEDPVNGSTSMPPTSAVVVVVLVVITVGRTSVGIVLVVVGAGVVVVVGIVVVVVSSGTVVVLGGNVVVVGGMVVVSGTVVVVVVGLTQNSDTAAEVTSSPHADDARAWPPERTKKTVIEATTTVTAARESLTALLVFIAPLLSRASS